MKALSLYYLDNEGDEIEIDDNETLEHALLLVATENQNILKIMIRLNHPIDFVEEIIPY